MAEANLFSILGLSSEAIRGLDDEGIQTLLKYYARALSAVHHPDVGGEEARMTRINSALDRLTKDRNLRRRQSIQHLKPSFLRKSLERQKEENRSLQEMSDNRSTSMLGYLQCMCGMSKEENVFNFQSVFLRNVYMERVLNVKVGYGRALNVTGTIVPDSIFLLEVRDGVLLKRYIRKDERREPAYVYQEKEYPNKRLIGTISDDPSKGMLKGYSSGSRPKALTRQTSEPKHQIRRISAKLAVDMENRIPLDSFKECAWSLSPLLVNESYVFALNSEDGVEPFISLEGATIHSQYGFDPEEPLVLKKK
jgi:hypothetical protein